MAQDIFISYAKEDKTIADMVCSKLENDGIRCWIAPRDIAPGEKYATAIIRAIENAKIVVVVFSRNSDQSAHVRTEIERAFNQGKTIIPFRIENIEPSDEIQYFIGSRQWLDAFSGSYENYSRQLALIIKKHLMTDSITPGSQEQSSSSENNQYPGKNNSTFNPDNKNIKTGSALHRSVAYSIDVALSFFIGFSIFFILFIPLSIINSQLGNTVYGVIILIGMILFLGYFDIFGSQRSPGKRYLYLAIFKFPPLSQSRTWRILRFLIKIIPVMVIMIGLSLGGMQNETGTTLFGIGVILQILWLITMVFTAKSQSIHDLLAGTTVVSTKE